MPREYFCSVARWRSSWYWSIWYMAREPLGEMMLKASKAVYKTRQLALDAARAYANKVEIYCRF